MSMDDAEKQRQQQDRVEKTIAQMKALAQEIAAAWMSDKSAVELVKEQRREDGHTC